MLEMKEEEPDSRYGLFNVGVYFTNKVSRLSTNSYIPIKLLYFGSESYILKNLLFFLYSPIF
jgi:hypothetical protein